mgnify:CR=1 FL=1
MAEDWSLEEVAATVADYFIMLGLELRGEPYNKKAHNRRLLEMLTRRSAGAIEFKHANISAILIELGFPYIDGYKPRANYQELLRDEVARRLERDVSLATAAAAVVGASPPSPPPVSDLAGILEKPPTVERKDIYDRRKLPPTPKRDIDYLEIEARNVSLGRAGELFALAVEHRRLWEIGQRQLAERIEHVSVTRGDGLGYDILSFDPSGRELFIEVKTTNFGSMTPFFVSEREVTTSVEIPQQFSLYRVFKFREAPKIFRLAGSLKESCILDPIQFRAAVV